MTEFIPRDQVEWKTTRILAHNSPYEYKFDLPRPLADWDVWDYWEKERVESMRQHLQPGMTLFDVGTEQGWCDLIYAVFVGPENMVLIEPTPEFWPNIQATWERNFGDEVPLESYDGLFSDVTTDKRTQFHVWPDSADGSLIDRNSYKYIHEHGETIPQMRLDDFVARTGVVPQALTIDVEGSELLVLRGAAATLWEHSPLVWVSLHPTMMADNYGTTPEQLHSYMAGFGYTGTHLATDHEEHWLFS